MSELERALSSLAAEIDWPPTPELVLDFESAAALSRPRGRRRRIAVVVALAAALPGAPAFAVPGSRSAILRFFPLGGVTVERVSTLPAAEEWSLAADLGTPVTREQA